MAFCTECGADIPDDVKFCTSCGKEVGEAAQPVPAMAAAVSKQAETGTAAPQAPPIQRASPVHAVPHAAPMQSISVNADTAPPKGGKYAVMGTGAYIGTMLLFCIPIIGWLACIIMAFAAKNQNRRNFARAMLVFLIVGIVLSVVLYFVFSWVSEAVMQYINEATGDMFGEFGGFGDLFDMINGAGLSGQ